MDRCRCENNSVYQHSNAVICGKSFTAGEGLRRGRRSGSVITAVVGGRSMYGLVKKFIRVCCIHLHYRDFAILSWLPPPTYPDNDPLTVKISTLGIPLTTIYDSCRKIGVGGVFNLLVLDNQSKFSVTDFRLNYWVLLGTNEGCAL